MTVRGTPNTNQVDLDRRSLLVALAAAIALPGSGLAAGTDRSWAIGTVILAGTRPRNLDFLTAALEVFQGEFGAATANRLRGAVLQRDAASIVDLFEDPVLETAARHLVEILYTGDLPSGQGAETADGFQQSVAWQVLGFTKPPSICGPGFGWWSAPPNETS